MVGNPARGPAGSRGWRRNVNHTAFDTLTVNREGLASILKRSASTIRRQLSESPERLPPAVMGTKPRIWQVATVQSWMSQKEGLHVAPTVQELVTQAPRRGRPRKAAGRGAP